MTFKISKQMQLRDILVVNVPEMFNFTSDKLEI